MAGRLQFARHLAAMAGHPDIVPGEHRHREKQDGGVEQFLAIALEQGRQFAGESRDQTGAQYARQHAAGDRPAAPGHALGGGQHDADDQTGFDHFAEDDEQRGQHYSAITTPWAVAE